jgi:enoyl-CoA hydratase/carnithine racemase
MDTARIATEGTSIAMDVARIAKDGAWIAMDAARIGMDPAHIGTRRVPRTVREARWIGVLL